MQMRRSISHLAQWTLIGLLMLSFLAAAAPQTVQAAELCAETHTVQGGETIYKISKEYEMSVNRIATTNNLEKPYALTVGQTLCIPGKATGAANATWTATFSNNKVNVDGTSFKKQYPFIIKVREGDSGTWYKLGQERTSNTGVLDESFNVPSELSKVPALNVCLKDVFTDVLLCKRVFRQ